MKFAVDTSSLLANYIPTNDVEQAILDLILNGVVDAIVNKWQDALNVRPSDPLNFFDGGFAWTDYCPIVTDYESGRIDVDNPYPSEQRCFELEEADSVCLDFECEADKYQVQFKYGKNMYECKADFDTITVKGLGEVVCPRVASICPSIGCPAHCSGAGFCNWNNKPGPKFICFDPDDDTEGCYGDMKREGGKGGRKGGDKLRREKEILPKGRVRGL
jgi:hypothetical protein